MFETLGGNHQGCILKASSYICYTDKTSWRVQGMILRLNLPEKPLSITKSIELLVGLLILCLLTDSFFLIMYPFRLQRLCTALWESTSLFPKSPMFLILKGTEAKKLNTIQSSFSNWAFISYFTTVSLIPTFSLGCSVCQAHSMSKIPADLLRCYTVRDTVWQACVFFFF